MDIIILVVAVLLIGLLCFKNVPTLVSGILCSVLLLVIYRMDIYDGLLNIYMGGLVGFAKSWLILFTLGALFGKLLEATGGADSLTRVRVNPDRFVKSLVTDPGCIDEPLDLMEDLFMLAAITQDVSHLGIESFYEIFTREELYALWECENVRRYLIMGPSARFGDPLVADARPLLRNIVETADRVVAGESDLSASLRFGHDTYVVPLLALLRAEGAYARVESLDDVAAAWNAHTVTPMGTNVQFIFFRNPETGDVRVRVLHNERDANLPLAGGPYYPWKELKRYCEALYGAEN